MKTLSIILTLYKPKESELIYWSNFYKNRKDIDFYILVDNPNLDVSGYFESKDIFNNEKNIGKFSTILNFIGKNLIKSTHFKSVDPDDYIIESRLNELLKMDLDENTIYSLGFFSIEKSHLIFSADNDKFSLFLENNSRKINNNAFGNPSTILATKPLQHVNNILEFVGDRRVDMGDDILLPEFSVFFGADYKFIAKPFYVYVANNGMSNKDNIITLLDSCLIFLEIMQSIFEKENKLIRQPSWYIFYHDYFNKILNELVDKNQILEVDKLKLISIIKTLKEYSELTA